MSEATDVEEPKPAETSEVVEAAPVPSELDRKINQYFPTCMGSAVS